MAPKMITLPEKRLLGLKQRMSLSRDQTVVLWKEFMTQWKAVGLSKTEFYSVEVYPKGYFESFDPHKAFEKWAAVAETEGLSLPPAWELLEVPKGLYAVFQYKGTSSDVSSLYRYILGTWVPNSQYSLDHLPHFAIMREKYKNDDPESEEELWIPVKFHKISPVARLTHPA